MRTSKRKIFLMAGLWVLVLVSLWTLGLPHWGGHVVHSAKRLSHSVARLV